MSDNVKNPKHYQLNGYEVIDVLRDTSSKEEFNGFLINNVKKYILRYKGKNGIEDLKKAHYYLSMFIEENNK
jgi:hypothetical protein